MLKNKQNKFSIENPRIQFLILILTCFIPIFFFIIFGKLFINPFMNGCYYIDERAYYFMGKHFFLKTMAPFKYRILTPLLVFLLPFDTFVGFIIINLSALYCSSVLFFYYLKRLDFNFKVSLIGVLIYIFNPINIHFIWAICLIDLLFIFFFLLSFYAILSENDKLFIISTSLGMLNKEAMFLALLLFFFQKLKDKNLIAAIKSSILVSLPPIILFLIVRLLLIDYNLDSWYFSYDFILFVISTNYKMFQLSFFYHLYNFFIIFGMMWFLSIINLQKLNNKFLKRSLFLLPFIFAQFFLGTSFSRLFFIAFPIIIPISLNIFKYEISKKKIIIIILIATFLLIAHIITVYHLIEVIGYKFAIYNILLPESYSYMIFLELFSEIFVIFVLIYRLFLIFKIQNNRNNKTLNCL